MSTCRAIGEQRLHYQSGEEGKIFVKVKRSQEPKSINFFCYGMRVALEMRNGKDFLLSRINDSLTVMATRSCTQRGLQLGVQTPAGSIQPCLIVSKNRSIRFCHGSRNVVSNRHTIC